MHVTDQVLVIYAGTHGWLDKIPVEEVSVWEREFLRFIHEKKQHIWNRITQTKDLDSTTEADLEAALREFDDLYQKQRQTRPVTIRV
jgi:F-type H+-transporting ATPase subunit alpha